MEYFVAVLKENTIATKLIQNHKVVLITGRIFNKNKSYGPIGILVHVPESVTL